MIWGDSELHLAESVDLVNWNLTNNSANWNTWAKAIFTRENKLLESGPAPVKMAGNANQWIFVYNAATTGGGDLPKMPTPSIKCWLIIMTFVKDQLQD